MRAPVVERKVSGSETRQRERLVPVRMTDDERDLVRERAQAAGLTVGAYIRRTALGDSGPRARRRPIIERELLSRILAHLGKVGSNLNQLAREQNTGGTPDADDLARSLDDLAQMRRAILEAMGREP